MPCLRSKIRDGFSRLCLGRRCFHRFVWGQGRQASRVVFKFCSNLWIWHLFVYGEKVQEKNGSGRALVHQLRRHFIRSVSLHQIERRAGNIVIEKRLPHSTAHTVENG